MEIIPAKESDIIEALYVIKIAYDSNNISRSYWRPPIPDFDNLRNEIKQNNLYMIRHNSISIGTLSFADEFPDTYKHIDWKGDKDQGLLIKQIAIVPTWLSDDLKTLLQEFLENFARENNHSSIKLNVYSTNEEMNRFYEKLGFESRNSNKNNDFESPFNYYEKLLDK